MFWVAVPEHQIVSQYCLASTLSSFRFVIACCRQRVQIASYQTVISSCKIQGSRVARFKRLEHAEQGGSLPAQRSHLSN